MVSLNKQRKILSNKYAGKEAILYNCIKPTSTTTKNNQYWGVTVRCRERQWPNNNVNHIKLVNDNGRLIMVDKRLVNFAPA